VDRVEIDQSGKIVVFARKTTESDKAAGLAHNEWDKVLKPPP
jgi:hypothetical protein